MLIHLCNSAKVQDGSLDGLLTPKEQIELDNISSYTSLSWPLCHSLSVSQQPHFGIMMDYDHISSQINALEDSYCDAILNSTTKYCLQNMADSVIDCSKSANLDVNAINQVYCEVKELREEFEYVVQAFPKENSLFEETPHCDDSELFKITNKKSVILKSRSKIKVYGFNFDLAQLSSYTQDGVTREAVVMADTVFMSTDMLITYKLKIRARKTFFNKKLKMKVSLRDYLSSQPNHAFIEKHFFISGAAKMRQRRLCLLDVLDSIKVQSDHKKQKFCLPKTLPTMQNIQDIYDDHFLYMEYVCAASIFLKGRNHSVALFIASWLYEYSKSFTSSEENLRHLQGILMLKQLIDEKIFSFYSWTINEVTSEARLKHRFYKDMWIAYEKQQKVLHYYNAEFHRYQEWFSYMLDSQKMSFKTLKQLKKAANHIVDKTIFNAVKCSENKASLPWFELVGRQLSKLNQHLKIIVYRHHDQMEAMKRHKVRLNKALMKLEIQMAKTLSFKVMDDLLHTSKSVTNMLDGKSTNFQALKGLEGLKVVRKEAQLLIDVSNTLHELVLSAKSIIPLLSENENWKSDLLGYDQFFKLSRSIWEAMQDLQNFENLKIVVDDFFHRIYLETDLKAAKEVKIVFDDIVFTVRQHVRYMLSLSHTLFKYATDQNAIASFSEDLKNDDMDFLPYLRELKDWWMTEQLSPLSSLISIGQEYERSSKNTTLIAFERLFSRLKDTAKEKFARDDKISAKLSTINEKITAQGSHVMDLFINLCAATFFATHKQCTDYTFLAITSGYKQDLALDDILRLKNILTDSLVDGKIPSYFFHENPVKILF